MTTKRDVRIFVEQNDGQLADVSLELLSKGRELADQVQGQVCAVLCGSQVHSLADTAIHCGADRVFLADDPELAIYRTMPYARIISALVKERQPYIFLFGATSQGRDLAPRVASAVRQSYTDQNVKFNALMQFDSGTSGFFSATWKYLQIFSFNFIT